MGTEGDEIQEVDEIVVVGETKQSSVDDITAMLLKAMKQLLRKQKQPQENSIGVKKTISEFAGKCWADWKRSFMRMKRIQKCNDEFALAHMGNSMRDVALAEFNRLMQDEPCFLEVINYFDGAYLYNGQEIVKEKELLEMKWSGSQDIVDCKHSWKK